jgi:hypothetical protein
MVMLMMFVLLLMLPLALALSAMHFGIVIALHVNRLWLHDNRLRPNIDWPRLLIDRLCRLIQPRYVDIDIDVGCKRRSSYGKSNATKQKARQMTLWRLHEHIPNL